MNPSAKNTITEITARRPSFVAYGKRVVDWLYFLPELMLRDIRVKYSQTLLGVGWTLVYPFIFLIIYAVFFHGILAIDVREGPYLLYLISSWWIWILASNSFAQSANAWVAQQDMVRKLAVPGYLFFLSRSGIVFMESLVLLVGLLVVGWWYDALTFWLILKIPIAAILAILLGQSAGVLIAIWAVRKRDILHIIPFITQVGIWVTPVFYSPAVLPAPVKEYLFLHPVAGITHWLQTGLSMEPSYWSCIWIHIFLILVLGIASFVYLARKEPELIDYL